MELALKLLHSPEALDEAAFLAVFRQSSRENAPEWYPDLSPEQALERYETSYLEYMRGPFWAEGGILALLADESGYRSSLRLYPMEGKNRFFAEALETRPDSRRQGFGAEVLRRTAQALEAELGPVELISNTYKANTASRAAHAAAGFEQALDWWEEAGIRDRRQVTLIYTTPRGKTTKGA